MLKFLFFASLFFLAGAVSIPTSFVLIGDSTTATGFGWGNGFCGSSNPNIPSTLEPGTPCFNTAVNSQTANSFITNGYWDTSVAHIKGEVAKGRRTIVTIQFGHNERAHGFTPQYMGANLTTMIRAIRDLHAEPVLFSPLVIRQFRPNGAINDVLAPYAAEASLIAKQQKAHFVDLHGASLKYCESIGATACERLNRIPTDTTHLNEDGKIVTGRMVADLLNSDFGLLGINLLPIVPNPELSYNISHGIPSY